MDLSTVSAVDLAQQLRKGALRAVDVMAATLDRIDAVNPDLNAIVSLRNREELLQEAAACDLDEKKRGPLHGVPIAVKDLVNVAGIQSTQGSPIFADHIPEKDDVIAARLRAAGAILIGKTNTPEFGLGSHTFNPVHGATGNPYAPDKSCGGSSGGAAVALASGMLALADGSDMMGSLRNPAAWNNVYGFRPSWGRVPSEPVGDMFMHQLSTLGPMARSPEDIALLLDVMSGPDPRVPYGSPVDPIHPLQPVDLAGVRIGWLGDWGGAFPMEPGVLEQCQSVLPVLERLGVHVDIVPAPFDAEEMWQSWITLRSFAIAAGLAPLKAHHDQLKDTAIWELQRGETLSAPEIQRASTIRSDWYRAAHTLFDDYDALILPSAQVWPFDLNTPYPTDINGTAMDTYHRWMQVVIPVSLIGLPSLAMPAGFGSAGLPMGVQIFGPRGGDEALLQIGAAYHAATHWPQERPAV